jgi:hypothetical protein
MQHGHGHGNATWTLAWICSIGMDMQHRHEPATWTWIWTCGMDMNRNMQHPGNAARTWTYRRLVQTLSVGRKKRPEKDTQEQ